MLPQAQLNRRSVPTPTSKAETRRRVPLVEGRVLPSYGKVPTVQERQSADQAYSLLGTSKSWFFVHSIPLKYENPMRQDPVRGGVGRSGLSLYAGIVAFV